MYSKWLLEEVWATRPERGHGREKDAPSPPPPPDYTGAATAQGTANVQTAVAQSVLGNQNQVTPYGTLSYDQTGTYTIPAAGDMPSYEIPIFTSSVNFSPEGQQRFDQEQRIIAGLGDIAEDGLTRVGDTMGTPFDMSSVPAAPDPQNEETRQAVAASLMERQQPYFDQRREASEADLLARGFDPGGEAWNAGQNDLSRAENDYRLAADISAGQEQSRIYGLQSDARQQAIAEQAYLRSLPLNELNALRTGSALTMPQFRSTSGPGIAPPPLFSATGQQAQWDQNIWNQQAAATNASNQGLYGLGAAGLGAAAMLGF